MPYTKNWSLGSDYFVNPTLGTHSNAVHKETSFGCVKKKKAVWWNDKDCSLTDLAFTDPFVTLWKKISHSTKQLNWHLQNSTRNSPFYKFPHEMIWKDAFVFRDDKKVNARGDDGYQVYSVSASNIQLGEALVGYCLPRLNKFWYPPSPCPITVYYHFFLKKRYCHRNILYLVSIHLLCICLVVGIYNKSSIPCHFLFYFQIIHPL